MSTCTPDSQFRVTVRALVIFTNNCSICSNNPTRPRLRKHQRMANPVVAESIDLE